jgi:hypothetical protein
MFHAVIGPSTYVVNHRKLPKSYRFVAAPFLPYLPTPVEVKTNLGSLLPGRVMSGKPFVLAPSPFLSVPTVPVFSGVAPPVGRVVAPGPYGPHVVAPVPVGLAPPVPPLALRAPPPPGVLPFGAPMLPLPLTGGAVVLPGARPIMGTRVGVGPAVVAPAVVAPAVVAPLPYIYPRLPWSPWTNVTSRSLTNGDLDSRDPMEFLSSKGTWDKVTHQTVLAIKTGSNLSSLSDGEIDTAVRKTVAQLCNWWEHNGEGPGSNNITQDRIIQKVEVTNVSGDSNGTKQVTITYKSFIYRVFLAKLVEHVHGKVYDSTPKKMYTQFTNVNDKFTRGQFLEQTVKNNPTPDLNVYLNKWNNKDHPNQDKFKALIGLVAQNTKGFGLKADQFGGDAEAAREQDHLLEAMFTQNFAQQVYAEIIRTVGSGNVREMVPRLEKLMPLYNASYHAAEHYSKRL